ncbi:MAG: hypothetical protein L0220_30180 [Acidobacteria bacterium]|nr:hypothetical protein [Acidobacteriota bacterium]
MPIQPSLKIHLYCFISAIFTLLSIVLIFPSPGSSHEPITTKVMFNKEIIRIFQRNCLSCHSPGKIKADIPLTTYDEARPWAKAIKEEVLEKRMMPYQAVKGFGRFHRDYIVPQRDVDLIVSWVEGGAPRGEEKDYPKDEIEQSIKGDAWSIGPPDLILQPEQEIKIDPGTQEVTRCFLLSTGLSTDRWINAVEFRPGNGTVVFSASLFIERGKRKTDNNSCNSDAGFEFLSNWVPGQAAVRLPNGFAQFLPAGSRIAVRISYRNTGDASTDRSRIGLYFSKEKISESVRQITINAPAATTPVNGDRYSIKVSYPVNISTTAVAIRPLLFPHVSSLEVTVNRPDGTIEVLIIAKNYRFDWQPTYYFKKPVTFPKGSRIEVTAYLDMNDSSPSLKFAGPLCSLALASTI